MDINHLNKNELLELKTQIENKLRETINNDLLGKIFYIKSNDSLNILKVTAVNNLHIECEEFVISLFGYNHYYNVLYDKLPENSKEINEDLLNVIQVSLENYDAQLEELNKQTINSIIKQIYKHEYIARN
jgi:hypothetical protein